MKKIIFYLSAVAAVIFTGCSNEEVTTPSVENIQANNGMAINFNSGSNRVTRADITGGDAAALLNNNFRVYGVINNNGAETPIFDNYVVKYNGEAGSDSTNTNGWTYLGFESIGLIKATQSVMYCALNAP